MRIGCSNDYDLVQFIISYNMPSVKPFTSQKVSSHQENRITHFHRLSGKHTSNAIVIVGPAYNAFPGALAIEFQPLSYNPMQLKSANVKRESQIQLQNHSVIILADSDKKVNMIGQLEIQPARQIKRQNIEQPMDVQAPQILQSNCTEIERNTSFEKHISNSVVKSVIQVKNAIQIIDDSSQQEIGPQLYEQFAKLPVYNSDKLHYTPSFCLKNGSLNVQDCKLQFQRKLSDNECHIEINNIYEPRPRTKQLYCGICKQHYQEYLGHVKGKMHLDVCKRNLFTQHIKTLELQMNIGKSKKDREKQLKRLKLKDEKNRKREEELAKKKENPQKNNNDQQQNKKDKNHSRPNSKLGKESQINMQQQENKRVKQQYYSDSDASDDPERQYNESESESQEMIQIKKKQRSRQKVKKNNNKISQKKQLKIKTTSAKIQQGKTKSRKEKTQRSRHLKKKVTKPQETQSS